MYNNSGSPIYALFDSHGRKEDGTRCGSKSAILFFKGVVEFINFFLSENPPLLQLLTQKQVHDTSRNVIIVPLHFLDITNDINFEDMTTYCCDKLLCSICSKDIEKRCLSNATQTNFQEICFKDVRVSSESKALNNNLSCNLQDIDSEDSV